MRDTSVTRSPRGEDVDRPGQIPNVLMRIDADGIFRHSFSVPRQITTTYGQGVVTEQPLAAKKSLTFSVDQFGITSSKSQGFRCPPAGNTRCIADDSARVAGAGRPKRPCRLRPRLHLGAQPALDPLPGQSTAVLD